MMKDNMERITSLQNNRIKQWMKLRQKKERDRTGLFLAEGEHMTQEALQAGRVKTLITDLDDPVFEVPETVYVTEPVMKKLSESVSGTHYIAVCRKPDPEVTSYNRLLLLDGIQDPGNIGTMVRTAVSFGFNAVWCSPDTCDIYNEKALRSTQGAVFHIPVIYASLPDVIVQLKREDVSVIASALRNAEEMSAIAASERMAFIIGSEGQGVSQKCLDSADRILKIEMDGFESLNAGVAAGIIMYTYRK